MTEIQHKTLSNMANTEKDRLLFAVTASWTLGRSCLLKRKISDADAEIKNLFPINTFTGRSTNKDDCRAVRFIARLKPMEVLGFLVHSGIQFPDPDPDAIRDEDGVCPICGTEVEYDGCEEDNGSGGGSWGWKCPNCGATGDACFDRVFDRHYNVRNVMGNKIPWRPD